MYRPALPRAVAAALCLTLHVSLAHAGLPDYARTDYPSGGSDPRAVGVGDLNRDGRPDLIVVNRGTNTVSVLLGSGGGAFGATTDFAVGDGAVGLRVVDVDGDGRVDVVTSNAVAGTVSVLIGDGSGGLDPKRDYATGAGADALVAADFNGDGALDLATASSTTGLISLLRANGDGTFRPRVDFAAGGAVGVTAVDVNQDGRPDLVAPNGPANTLSIRLNTTVTGSATLTFAAAVGIATGNNPVMAAGGDLDGDGKPDLVSANSGPGTCSVLHNLTAPGAGAPAFAAWPTVTSGSTGTPALLLGDLNGNGLRDLVVVDAVSDALLLLEGIGAGGFGPPVAVPTNGSPVSVTLAALDSDVLPDLVTANSGAGDVSVLLGAYFIHAAASAGGTIDPEGDVPVSAGANVTFTFTPDACYRVTDVEVDGVSVGTPGSYTLVNVQAIHAIDVTFTPDYGQHTIMATAGTGGSISPSGAVSVSCYDYTPFTITPDPDYTVADLLVDGVSVGSYGYYPFQGITGDHTIHAVFRRFPLYDIMDITPAGGTTGGATDLSPNGHATGYYRDASNHVAPFSWWNGVSIPVPTLGGTYAVGRGVDDAGRVCGGSYLPGGSTLMPFYWNGAATVALPLLPGGTTGEAMDMNGAAGRMVGYSNATNGASRAVYWDNGGAPVDLGLLPNGYAARAVAINDQGWILGQCTVYNTNEGSDHVFIWRDGVLEDLTVGEYGTHIPLGFDNAGRVVGYDQGFSGGLFYKSPFLLETDGSRTSLPLAPTFPCGWASAINGSGQIVGYSGWPWSGGNAALLYQDGQLRGLSALVTPGHGWSLQRALSINDSGDIVGEGMFGGAARAFLLRPAATSAVPATPALPPVPLELSPPWPNPAERSVTIRYNVAAAGSSALSVFDVTGRQVRALLLDGTPGAHEVTWDGNDTDGRPVSSGLYWIRLTTASGRVARSVVIVH